MNQPQTFSQRLQNYIKRFFQGFKNSSQSIQDFPEVPKYPVSQRLKWRFIYRMSLTNELSPQDVEFYESFIKEYWETKRKNGGYIFKFRATSWKHFPTFKEIFMPKAAAREDRKVKEYIFSKIWFKRLVLWTGAEESFEQNKEVLRERYEEYVSEMKEWPTFRNYPVRIKLFKRLIRSSYPGGPKQHIESVYKNVVVKTSTLTIRKATIISLFLALVLVIVPSPYFKIAAKDAVEKKKVIELEKIRVKIEAFETEYFRRLKEKEEKARAEEKEEDE